MVLLNGFHLSTNQRFSLRFVLKSEGFIEIRPQFRGWDSSANPRVSGNFSRFLGMLVWIHYIAWDLFEFHILDFDFWIWNAKPWCSPTFKTRARVNSIGLVVLNLKCQGMMFSEVRVKTLFQTSEGCSQVAAAEYLTRKTRIIPNIFNHHWVIYHIVLYIFWLYCFDKKNSHHFLKVIHTYN